jgi:uncharacterized membrane protein YccC
MRTGITALQALLGNLIGFAVAALGMVALDGDDVALWSVLPVFVFLSAYAPAAIHFVIGQASFTVLVVILFNILEPEGWRTGLVRVESVALGAAISLLVGVVFWPRGNRRALREATADFYRAVSTYVGAALATLTRAEGSRPDPEVIAGHRRDARAAELRADEALFDLLATPNSANAAAVTAWARLTSIGRSLRLTGDGIRALSYRPLAPIRAGDDQRELDALGAARVPEIASIGDRIEGSGTTAASAAAPEPPVDALRTWLDRTDRDDPESVGRTVAMVWCVEWIDVVDALVALDDEPLQEVVATADLPWWR